MYDYIRGVLAEKSQSEATVEAEGVGYRLIIPLSTCEKLPQPGAEIKLYSHHYVREDNQKLYGFFSKLEREIFRQLIAISNIGPKTAISILSGLSPQELVSCINRGDASRLRKVPGVGDKTAQRLMVELKGKLGAAVEGLDQAASLSRSARGGNEQSQAFEAMISLGYSEKQVQAAFGRVESVIQKDAPVEEWIKKALQVI